ncbi:MAG: MarR family transcriptional regulator, lower aerobic nicotinate degradation pathway regulator [Microbacteriaceae bacterium]|jgi:DNA-binding MarR family transcriptional regulator|nr:MarR family transcriptional regulator, lower aerobic nicotinate degradation pathway regulator [Microbacteriaceae bacterium]MDT4904817.1 MarR family transcriptional regulator, lower aerobic nicotinate degradation pathway regulator [Pseudonocardiales bacterium]
MASEFDLHAAPGHLLRRAQQLHAAVFAEVVSEADLTTPQFAVLTALRSSPGIDQVRLSQHLGIDRSTIADVSTRLEERGLIRRQRDGQDARRNLLTLTRAGRALYDRTMPEVVDVGKRLVAPLTAKEQALLMKFLTAIVAAHDPNFDASAPSPV